MELFHWYLQQRIRYTKTVQGIGNHFEPSGFIKLKYYIATQNQLTVLIYLHIKYYNNIGIFRLYCHH